MTTTATERLTTGIGEHTYQWIDNWAKLPDNETTRENGRTHGVVVSKAGDVYVFAQANPAVIVYDTNGNQKEAWGDRFPGAHGMTLVEEDGTEYLWLTDQNSGEVVKTTLDGKTVQTIEKPDIAHYQFGGRYSPTWVAVNEARRGGNGDIWVADGYGQGLVHRYDKTGKYWGSISGEQGAGKFACPHGIAFRFDGAAPELYVADRGNQRVQVFDGEGKFKRVVGAKTLHSPCMFAFHEGLGLTLIPELFSRVDLLDGEDNLVSILADNGYACTVGGWPNHNVTGKPELIEPGKFNSPHGATFDADGNIYVVEWIIGGRITKLARC
ncbi:MAG: hypothetical protein ACODAQ_01710 [Phycisphaeraceae bacterium]